LVWVGFWERRGGLLKERRVVEWRILRGDEDGF